MNNVTAEDVTRVFICILVVLLLIAVYALDGLRRLWEIHFHRKCISGVYQTMKLFGWLLLAASTSFCTTFIFWGLTLLIAEALR